MSILDIGVLLSYGLNGNTRPSGPGFAFLIFAGREQRTQRDRSRMTSSMEPGYRCKVALSWEQEIKLK